MKPLRLLWLSLLAIDLCIWIALSFGYVLEWNQRVLEVGFGWGVMLAMATFIVGMISEAP